MVEMPLGSISSLNYFYFTSLPQTYPTLIISGLHSYGTKMFPQFE